MLQAHSLLFWWLFLSFLSWTLFPFVLPFPSHIFALHSHVLFLFPPISPISTSVLLVCLSLASWWPFPCDLIAPLATCVLWLPLADVAHHRAQHALNKPSNPKTPQGTILSASNLSPPLCPPCGCQPPPSVAKTWQAFLCLHVVINSTLAATTSEFLFIFKAKGVFRQCLWYKTKMISRIFFKLKQ